MAAKLVRSEEVQLDVDSLVTADIIAIERDSVTTTLWIRPLDEIERRGPPYNIQTAVIACNSVREIRQIEAVVARLKNGD